MTDEGIYAAFVCRKCRKRTYEYYSAAGGRSGGKPDMAQGSGIYFGKHSKELMELVGKFCDKKAYTFVFSTSGASEFQKNNSKLVKLLESKNKVVLGSFGCRAFDKFGPFKLVGGINKGHPNADDLKNAQDFISDVIKKYEKQEEK